MTGKRSHAAARSLIYGIHPVQETLKVGRRRVDAVYLSRVFKRDSPLHGLLEQRETRVKRVSDEELSRMAGTPNHQGICAGTEPFPYHSLDEIIEPEDLPSHVLVILDEIQDPGNLGNIIRSAECLGAAGVVLSRDRSAAVTPAVEKVAAGASAHIPIARVVNVARALENLKREGYWIFAAEMTAGHTWFSAQLGGKTAFVLGSEAKGIRRLVREKCDLSISIPLVGRIDSLNVAQAATVLLAEALRQRTVESGKPED